MDFACGKDDGELLGWRDKEWSRRDSNPGPLLCESSALTS